MIQQRVTKYIEKEHLFSPDDKILVALSGGADSVALLYILHTAGYHCEAAHCNFHLRGKESDRTSYLSANFAKEWKSIYIPLISTRPNMQRKNIFRLKWPHGNSATNGSRKLEKNVRQMLSLWPITRMIA